MASRTSATAPRPQAGAERLFTAGGSSSRRHRTWRRRAAKGIALTAPRTAPARIMGVARAQTRLATTVGIRRRSYNARDALHPPRATGALPYMRTTRTRSSMEEEEAWGMALSTIEQQHYHLPYTCEIARHGAMITGAAPVRQVGVVDATTSSQHSARACAGDDVLLALPRANLRPRDKPSAKPHIACVTNISVLAQ